MALVVITGWKAGLRKVRMTRLLQERAGLDLAAAKDCTDRVLQGEPVSLLVSHADDATALAAALRDLGAEARVADDGR